MLELALIAGLSLVATLYARERHRAHRTHTDPCLHDQGLVALQTWQASEPELFRRLAGKAIEFHLGGVAWFLATKPPKRHPCKPQTCGITETLQHYDICACGGVRYGVWGHWERRNSRG